MLDDLSGTGALTGLSAPRKLSVGKARRRGITSALVLNPNYTAEIRELLDTRGLRITLHDIGAA